MAGKRAYGDRCGIARALDLVGERWALLVVRELLLGPKRFADLRTGLPHIGPDVLTQRLRELEAAGIVQRRTLPPPAGSRVYELTARGADLEPVVLALGTWGSRAPFTDAAAPLGVDATMLALRTLFDAAAAAGMDARYEVRLGEQAFAVRVCDGCLQVDRATVADPDAVIQTDPDGLSAVLWHARSLAEAGRAGVFTYAGSRSAVERFLTLFPAPRPAATG